MGSNTATAAAPVFDLADLDTADTAEWNVTHDGKEIGWVWIFAGPGHQATIDLGNRLAKKNLAVRKAQEQAQVNGKKWKPDDEDPEQIRKENASLITSRLLGWTEINLGGKPFPYTPENALSILLDRKKSFLMAGALEFLADDKSFMTRSAKI